MREIPLFLTFWVPLLFRLLILRLSNFEAPLFFKELLALKLLKINPHSSEKFHIQPTNWSKLGFISLPHTPGSVWNPVTLRTPSIDPASDY